MASTRPEFQALSHFATTNAAPSAQDAAFILKIVQEIDLKAADKRSRLLAIEYELRELERERKFFKPMLSPLRRIPLEILGEIFTYAVDTENRDNAMLASISRVSRGWHEAALLFPRLWNDITINPSSAKLSYEGVATWLARSRVVQKTVRVTCSECALPSKIMREEHLAHPRCSAGRNGRECVFSNRDGLVKILTQTPLLECVEVCPPTPKCFKTLARSLQDFRTSSQPSFWDDVKLFTLSTVLWKDLWSNSYGDAFKFLPPSMMKLGLKLPVYFHISRETEEPEFGIPLTLLRRITSFTLKSDWPAWAIYNGLQHCTNLKNLTLDLDFSEEFCRSDAKWKHGLRLPALKTLRLKSTQGRAFFGLQHLKMPALQELSVSFGSNDWLPDEDDRCMMIINSRGVTRPFAAFLRGNVDTPPTLETLRITHGIFKGDYLLSAIQGLSSLKRLILDNTEFDTATFSKLSDPQLSSLELLRLHDKLSVDSFPGLQGYIDKHGTRLTVSLGCAWSDCRTCFPDLY